MTLKVDWLSHAVGYAFVAVFAYLAVHARVRVIPLAILLLLVIGEAWFWYRHLMTRISANGISIPRLFRAPSRITWDEVKRLSQIGWSLSFETAEQTLELNLGPVRNRKEILAFVRGHLPSSIVE